MLMRHTFPAAPGRKSDPGEQFGGNGSIALGAAERLWNERPPERDGLDEILPRGTTFSKASARTSPGGSFHRSRDSQAVEDRQQVTSQSSSGSGRLGPRRSTPGRGQALAPEVLGLEQNDDEVTGGQGAAAA